MPHLDHPEFNQYESRFASGIAPPPNSPTSELGAVEVHDDLPPLSLDHLNLQDPPKIQDKKKVHDDKERVLVVGISGCTSSGKSLLALILTKVFDRGKPCASFRMFLVLCVIPVAPSECFCSF